MMVSKSVVNLPIIKAEGSSVAPIKLKTDSDATAANALESRIAAVKERKAVCTCGKCHCRKHHCQVHHISTNTLMMDQKLKANYNPTSDYKDTFHPIENVMQTKRGLAIPARIFPELNSCRPMDTLSMSRKDFVEKPLIARVLPKPKRRKPDISKAPILDTTSYKLDYPRRKFDPNPMAESLMRTTLPQIIEVGPEENYCTTNQQNLKDWNEKHRLEGYKELQEEPFFVGKIQTESLTRNDFASIKDGKPRESCKKIETHLSNGKFDGSTTQQMVYKLPPLPQKRVVFSKHRSKVQLETMIPNQEGTEYLTHTQRDSCKLPEHIMRRCYCPPEPDKLSLFNQGNFNHQTEHKSTYVEHDEIPRPRTSFKDSQVLSTNPMEGASGKFYDDTTMNSHYQPVSCHVQASGVRDAKVINSKVSQKSKGSKLIQESQDFGEGFNGKTVNQSEYFKFWKVPPRLFHGEKARVYHPPKSKFDMMSETKAIYVTKKTLRVEPFKPLDTRFQKSPLLYSRKMAAESCYKSDFVPLPLPKPEICPAEQLLRQA